MIVPGIPAHNTMRRRLVSLLVSWLLLMPGPTPSSAADAVVVTATLDRASLRVGETTKLRVWGRVAPEIEPQSDRIFSWYVDGLNSSPETAMPLWDQLLMPACDSPTGSTPSSSRGTTQGATRTGIRNTFLTKPGAGKLTPVQLFEVEITAVAAGQAIFSVGPGTGTPAVTHDFQVARAGGGAAFTGGTYDSALVILSVLPDPDDDQDGLTNSEETALGSNPSLADSDFDGLTDLEEYTFGSSLTSPASAFRPAAATAPVNVGGNTAEYQEVIVRRSLSAQRVAIRVETSSGPGAWLLDAVLVSSQNNPDGTATDTWRCPQPRQSVSRSFLRVTVVRN